MAQTHKITRMLREWSDGNREALEELMSLVYDELHKQARRYLRRERPIILLWRLTTREIFGGNFCRKPRRRP